MPKIEKKKATPEAVLRFITERALLDERALTTPASRQEQTQGGSGTLITGPDLTAAAKHIDLIPDRTLRRQVHGLFMCFTKYQALGMILDPNGPYYRKHPEILEEAAAAATEAERNFNVNVPIGGLGSIESGGGG